MGCSTYYDIERFQREVIASLRSRHDTCERDIQTPFDKPYTYDITYRGSDRSLIKAC